MRFGLSGIFMIGVLGTFLELLLLDHTEDFWQLIPLVLLGVGFISFFIGSFTHFRLRWEIFRGIMVIFLLSGIYGFLLHYETNVEFEKEMYPGLEGIELFIKSMKGATPSLAPGAMMMLAFIGWLRSFKTLNS
jgi:hypothetical protein